jgi:hypothetical protein
LFVISVADQQQPRVYDAPGQTHAWAMTAGSDKES